MTILRLTLRGIRASLGRLILTMIAIVVGVGFVGAAFVLADSLQDTFGELFEQSVSGTDARVTVAELEFGDDTQTVPDTLIDEVASLPEVGEATGAVFIDSGESFRPFIVLDAEGEQVVPQGPPIISFSWGGEEVEGLIELADGRPPENIDETAIDSTYAAAAGVAAGDTITMVTPDGERDFLLAGTFDSSLTAGAYLVLFEFEAAQVLYDKEGQVDTIDLTRASGVDVATMIAAVEEVLPPEAEVLDQQEVIEQDSAGFEQFVSGFRTGLLVFALVALFVSAFIIYNTFQILITQRFQQIGMLRAIGATQRQIRLMMTAEAVVVGLVSSLIGIAVGLGIAELIKVAFQAAGGFPDTGTVLRPRTILVCLAVGIGVTIAAARIPARAAGRVSPIAAMRNDTARRTSPTLRITLGFVVLGVGVILLALGLFGGGSSVAAVGLPLGIGALLIFVGVAMLSVLFAGQVVEVLGRWQVIGVALAGMGLALLILMFSGDGPSGIAVPLKLLVAPVAVIAGISILVSGATGRRFPLGGSAAGLDGQLARRNAARSPQRTAATATALTIGIALVATTSVLGESLKESLAGTLDQSFQADLFIFDDESDGGLSGELADRLDTEVDGLSALSRFRSNDIRLDGTDVVVVSAFESDTGTQLIDYNVTDGSIDGLVDNGILVFATTAEERGLSVGDVLPVEFPDLETEDLTVVGIYEDQPFGTSWVIDLAVYERHVENDNDDFVGAAVADGEDIEAVKADVLAITDQFAGVTAQDTGEFQDSIEGQINTLVTLINSMLGLALVVALLGVLNTIVLSVVERTREIGLLRAVGTTRKQIRSVIRWESVIVCLFGAIVGIALGIVFAAASVQAIPDSIISVVAVPYETILFLTLFATLAGVVAAYFPARRAARINVLDAISTTS